MNNTTEKKRIKAALLILTAVVILISAIITYTEYLREEYLSDRLTDEEIAQLRERYPTSDSIPASMSMARVYFKNAVGYGDVVMLVELIEPNAKSYNVSLVPGNEIVEEDDPDKDEKLCEYVANMPDDDPNADLANSLVEKGGTYAVKYGRAYAKVLEVYDGEYIQNEELADGVVCLTSTYEWMQTLPDLTIGTKLLIVSITYDERYPMYGYQDFSYYKAYYVTDDRYVLSLAGDSSPDIAEKSGMRLEALVDEILDIRKTYIGHEYNGGEIMVEYDDGGIYIMNPEEADAVKRKMSGMSDSELKQFKDELLHSKKTGDAMVKQIAAVDAAEQ